MKIFIIVLIIAVILFLLYLLSIAPRKKKINKNLLTNYAHRGLWGRDIPENSLSAFENAVKNGFGIELDVQLSKDDVVMVFHDYSLKRMTGTEGDLKDFTKDQLKELSLLSTNEKIPTFEEVLQVVDGKIPLLIELKGENLDNSLCPKVARILENYKGEYCVESFNPLLIKDIKKFLPDVVCGQLYTNVIKEKKKFSLLNLILTMMSFNFLAKPDFIAYNKNTRKSLPVILTTKFFKAPAFVWTMKDNDERFSGECEIFEREKV